MKITIYALHLGVGGVEKYVITLANMLVTKHAVEIVSTYRIQEQPAFAVDPRVKITYLMEKLKPNKEELRQCISEKDWIGILREAWTSCKVLYLKKKRNIQSIKKCDSDVIISTRIFHNRIIGKYAGKDIVKITGEHNHHNGNQKYIQDVIDSCKNFDYFIPISKELCDFYQNAMAENGVKTEYIPFCIDDNPNPVIPALNNDHLISVGRMSHEKGIFDLIDVFEKVRKEKPDAVLHIVGDGEERTQIETEIREKKLEDAVVLHGFRDKAYIYGLLPKTSLYVMTSFTESFGIVLLEAMSCGIPCVAYGSAQGAHEIIKDGENGFLIEGRDSEKMKEKICELLENREELVKFSQNAFTTAEKFCYSNTRNAWLHLMCSIEERKIDKR